MKPPHKENLVWMPILFLSVINLIYLILIMAGMMLMASTNDSMLQWPWMKLFSVMLTVEGWGLVAILISNTISVVLGIGISFFIRKTLSPRFKKMSVCFLVIFYCAIVFSSFYLFFGINK